MTTEASAMLKRMSVLMFLTVIICAGCATTSDELTYYVSVDGDDTAAGTSSSRAFRTLSRARDEIRALKRDGSLTKPVTVTIMSGVHTLEEPLIFTDEDAGSKSCPITYAGEEGGGAIISGGRKIDGWTDAGDGLWTVELPSVAAGEWYFNQLYVNSELRRRARIPNDGFLRVKGFPEGTHRTVGYHTDCKSFEYAPGDLNPSWHNLSDIEVIVYHFWTDSHLPIESIDESTHIVTFKHRAGKVFTDDFSEDGARYIVENVYEGLDAPGEWYLDRKSGTLSYRPMPGESIDTVRVIAPVIPEFFRLEGSPLDRRYVEHISFRNLTFEYTNWQLPPGNSNDRQGSATVPAAITLQGARQCILTNCTVRNIGTFAIELLQGCSGIRLTGNELSGLAAGGIRVNGGDEKRNPLEHSFGNIISDNHLHHYGELYPSAVGVLLMHTYGNRVEHNHIHHGWYTGISIGWRWGYQRSISRDNLITYNHIHDIGQGLLSDMGAIYTLGVSPGTVLRGNLIHDVNANHYGGWGIYHDEGSTHILDENNIVYNTKFACFNIHYAKEVTVRNNIFAGGRIDQITLGRVEPHVSVYFERNIVYWEEGVLMQTAKADTPYEFHVNPNRDKLNMSDTAVLDWNIYFNPAMPADSLRFGKETFAEWQARGNDVHSRYADPLFVDPAAHDYSLRPGSPAFELGFEPIDLSEVGPRVSPGAR